MSRPSALTIRQARADLLADTAKRPNITTADALAEAFASWAPAIYAQALADNLATGALTLDDDGRLTTTRADR